MVWSTFEYNNEFVTTEKIKINDIPCLLFKPNNNDNFYPTIIYYHGWQSNKNFQKFKASILATYGYQVIVPDAIYHGERNSINHTKPGMLEKYFWEVILQTVDESRSIINYILKELNTDSNKIGVMGSSMGGFIASGVFIKNVNLKTIIVFNGSCAWGRAEEIFRREENREAMNSKERNELLKYDPLNNQDRLKFRPILMIHGEEDTSVPIESQKYFYDKISKIYRENPEKIKFIKIPNMNHYISTGMFQKGIEWLKQNL